MRHSIEVLLKNLEEIRKIRENSIPKDLMKGYLINETFSRGVVCTIDFVVRELKEALGLDE